jgi:hypothetical protein
LSHRLFPLWTSGLSSALIFAIWLQAIVAIFVIRSDSYDALEHAKPLEGLNQKAFPLLPMPRGAFQTVIEGPAKRLAQAGKKFEIDPGLTQALLEDIEKGGGSDALPLLAFALEQLFRDHAPAKSITRENYIAFGGLKGAIEAALERVFVEADKDARIPKDREARLALLRRGLIPWLAGVDPETRTARRRIVRAVQIPEEARPLVDLLVEQRLLTRGFDKDSRRRSGEAGPEPIVGDDHIETPILFRRHIKCVFAGIGGERLVAPFLQRGFEAKKAPARCPRRS